ncbi:MAG: glycosyltransferase family 9 protein [Melioribacteraceae bacterium]|nr:glycosyltransferase family 9 protein [Melioribacteraceae bacterium]
MKIDPASIKKILLIKLRGIGDVVLSTIIFDSLQAAFPEAQVDFLTEKASKDFLLPLDEISNVYIFNRGSTKDRLKLILKIRKQKYDLVIDLFSNPATAQLTRLSGARYRLGFPYRGRKYAYNLFGPEARAKVHSADLHLELISALGIKPENNGFKFGLTEDAKLFANNYLSELNSTNDLICAIVPGGGWQSKRCDPSVFANIADSVIEKFGAKVLILWGPEDKNEAEQIKLKMINNCLFAPPTSLLEMGALLKNVDFTIANDSGPMHISVAVETPTLSLHGPTSPFLQGAFGAKNETVRYDELSCIECNLLECTRKHECFLELPIERVLESVRRLLDKNGIRKN